MVSAGDDPPGAKTPRSNAGMNDHISKPIDPEMLFEVVEEDGIAEF